MRRIGVLMNLVATDPEAPARIAAFTQGLLALGWANGGNVQIDIRWGAGDADLLRKNAAELVALAPDVILVSGTPGMGALQQVTRSVPIVFAQVVDPVGSGFVETLPRPGGNATGFMSFEYSISGKWLELIKEISPRVKRVGILRDLAQAAGSGQFGAIQAAASVLGVEVTPFNVSDPGEIRRAIEVCARAPDSGLVVTGSALALFHRELIITLAALHRLPTVYPHRYFIVSWGLISYGPNSIDPFRRAAGYIDRILKGERPADLPVQIPTKYELVVNLKTARSLGLTLPQSMLARADEVIE